MNCLLVYGTRFGSTMDIADRIHEILTEKNHNVDIYNANIEETVSPEPYELVIIGTCIIAGSWSKKIVDYLIQYSAILANRKVAFFISCGEALKPKRINWIKRNYIDKKLIKYSDIEPISVGVFGGVFDFYGKHKDLNNPYLDKIKQQIEAKGVDTSIPYDFRDWNAVEKWAYEFNELT